MAGREIAAGLSRTGTVPGGSIRCHVSRVRFKLSNSVAATRGAPQQNGTPCADSPPRGSAGGAMHARRRRSAVAAAGDRSPSSVVDTGGDGATGGGGGANGLATVATTASPTRREGGPARRPHRCAAGGGPRLRSRGGRGGSSTTDPERKETVVNSPRADRRSLAPALRHARRTRAGGDRPSGGRRGPVAHPRRPPPSVVPLWRPSPHPAPLCQVAGGL